MTPSGREVPYVGLYAGAYPWWHKADTYETMRLEAGSEETLEAGFQTLLDIVSPLIAYAASPAFEPDASA